jgi:hypothetical protein
MKVDSKVRYEDLKSNCQQAVLNMVGELGYMEEYSAVVERAKIFDEQGQLKSGSATANHYSGPKVEVPETVRTYIEGKLSSLRKTLGYI